ncbi:MAG TPA: PocR ligand-binding domain-containing protein, partial [Desulfatiglandales bacterium]|nr:PocR ligand-binding domain-containing protein [Desulfatiglandales bacterium]
SPEKWHELEKELFQRSGLNVSVFDADGSMISDYPEWANSLCPVIKDDEKGKGIICVSANNTISLIAKNSKRPVTEECDAGLLKFAVPIFSDNEFLGVITCCGLLSEDSEVETFLINKITGIDEDKIKSLSKNIRIITTEKTDSLIQYIEKELSTLIPDYKIGSKF